MDEILELLVPELFVIAGVFVILSWDERRMTPEQRARAWPTASRRIAAVYFTPLAVPLHFLRTRRDGEGASEGVLWGLSLLLVAQWLADGLDLLLPRLSPA
jgi:hypothetical protein